MKRMAVILMAAFSLVVACDMMDDASAGKDGELRVSFDNVPADDTRAALEIPDTNDFLLSVADSKGKVIYDGTYGLAPESIMVKPDSYNVRAVSHKFTKPSFSAPLFGDEQCVVVDSDKTASVKLICSQINSGIRLKISSDFLTAFPSASLVLKSPDGSLMYGYSEKRVAYFQPGNVSLILSQDGTDKSLMTRWLEPGEVLSLGISVSSSTQSGTLPSGQKEISVSIDTSRTWISDQFIIGGKESSGNSSDSPMGISQAMASVGEEDVWIRGYVVGGDLSSSSASFEEPFSSRTNIILGPKVSTNNRSSCISVQLPTGTMRDELNLVDNPEILGRRLCLKGDVVASYFGLVGIKNVSDYVLE